MIRVELDPDGLHAVLLGTSPHRDGPRLKLLQGARFDPAAKVWKLPLTWVTAVTLRGTFGADLELGEDFQEWAWAQRGRVDAVQGSRSRAMSPEEDWPGVRDLHPFQRTGVEFLRHAGSAGLLDDMGTGKTVMAAVHAAQLLADGAVGPVLVVCPKGVLRPWKDALATWAGIDAQIISGSVVQRRKQLAAAEDTGGHLVMTYDTLKAHTRLAGYGGVSLAKCTGCGGLDPQVTEARCEVHVRELNDVQWALVIADEAHKIKEPSSKQTRAVWWVGDKAAHRLALTGTPIDKSPAEAWSIWRFVAPEEVPAKSRFIDRWCQKTYNFFGGLELTGLNPETEPEFRTLFNLRFVRRPKDLVMRHLPPVVPSVRYVQMAPKQAKAYREMADGLVAQLDGGTLTSFSPLVQGVRLTQLAAATVEIVGTRLVVREDDEGNRVEVEVPNVRLCEPSPKLDELEDILEELGDRPVLVLGASRQLLDLAATRLSKRKVTFAKVLGGMDEDEIETERNAFNSGRTNIMLLSLGAAAEGLSLTRGSTVVFLDRHWRNLLNKQGIDRMHGLGRGDHTAKSLEVIDIVTEGTIEDHKLSQLEGKAATLEDLVRDREALRILLKHGGKS